jgi:hypothetical protein
MDQITWNSGLLAEIFSEVRPEAAVRVEVPQ